MSIRNRTRRRFLLQALAGVFALGTVGYRLFGGRRVTATDGEYPDHPNLVTVMTVRFLVEPFLREDEKLEEMESSISNRALLNKLNDDFIRKGKIVGIFEGPSSLETQWTYVFISWSAFREWEKIQRRISPITQPSRYESKVRAYPVEHVDQRTGIVREPLLAELKAEFIRIGISA